MQLELELLINSMCLASGLGSLILSLPIMEIPEHRDQFLVLCYVQPAKVRLVKAMVFLVVVYGYKRWTIKKVEHRSTDGFQTVVLEDILESPLDSKEIKPVNAKGNQP